MPGLIASPHYVVRPMTRPEVDFAIDMAAAEGWNPGLDDADAFFAADPQGFLVGLLDGRPVACLSAVKYDDAYGFMGFYVVQPELRGRGFGMRLFQAGLDRLRGCAIAGDGVLQMLPKYESLGFRQTWRNARFAWSGQPSPRSDAPLQPLTSLPFDAIRALDRRHFPAPREAFLRRWIAGPHAHALGHVDGALRGMGVVRRCHEGWKVGPLYAEDQAMARDLLHALAARALADAPGPVFLDVPEPNADALAMVEDLGMTRVFATARIHLGAPPATPLDRIYGITTFELG